MVDVYPTATGNWSTRTWNKCSDGTAYGMAPQIGDNVHANGVTVTIDADIHVNGLYTTANGSAAAGGGFSVTSGGRTVTVDSTIEAGSTHCLTFSAASPNSLTVNGTALTCKSSAATFAQHGLRNTSTGTLNCTCTGQGGAAGAGAAVHNGSSGTINMTGNATAAQAASGSYGAWNQSTGTFNLTGDVLGGVSNGVYGATNSSTGVLTVTGNVTGGAAGGAYGVINSAAGQVSVSGTITGGSAGVTSFGAFNNGTGKLLCLGPVVASATSPAISDTASQAGFVQVTGPITNSTGINAIVATHVCLTAECDWTIAKAGTPPAYNGTVTIGLKSGGGGGARLVGPSALVTPGEAA